MSGRRQAIVEIASGCGPACPRRPHSSWSCSKDTWDRVTTVHSHEGFEDYPTTFVVAPGRLLSSPLASPTLVPASTLPIAKEAPIKAATKPGEPSRKSVTRCWGRGSTLENDALSRLAATAPATRTVETRQKDPPPTHSVSTPTFPHPFPLRRALSASGPSASSILRPPVLT
ncbi:hypothetical protein BDK51DRAFT_45114 [Blyttiomyces helicus]|uniref:Uncharacterized protein n=1 Tax=Blyttiomyces helicus TaxID=388810 RepID=A0A4V1IR93_9FUNG|nr:hypothetical protein BDK51DRAFT_45114 [Blyttiomyces helicus]|eukprot:RKO89257.1 hypothetical protein BDK51DRAFT_45114 [Blyttiomyces helicus]